MPPVTILTEKEHSSIKKQVVTILNRDVKKARRLVTILTLEVGNCNRKIKAIVINLGGERLKPLVTIVI